MGKLEYSENQSDTRSGTDNISKILTEVYYNFLIEKNESLGKDKTSFNRKSKDIRQKSKVIFRQSSAATFQLPPP